MAVFTLLDLPATGPVESRRIRCEKPLARVQVQIPASTDVASEFISRARLLDVGVLAQAPKICALDCPEEFLTQELGSTMRPNKVISSSRVSRFS